jgi:predicted nucleic acid-binding protein
MGATTMGATTPAVVDTDVVSFLFKSHSLASAYQAILAGRPLAISLITLAEIEYGMELKNWGATRRDLMRRFLGRFTALSPDTETARLWARVKSAREKKGRPITFADAWIAAAALQLNVPLATHNVRDYAAIEHLVILTAPVTV